MGFSIGFRFWFRFWGTFGDNVSSSWYSESSWGWESTGWETELGLSGQESSIESWSSGSYDSWASNCSYNSWGSDLVSDKFSMLLNSNELNLLCYSGFLAYLMLDVLAFLLNNGINDGLYFNRASLFGMGGTSWFSWYSLLGWYAYLFWYVGTDIVYFSTVLGSWD